MARTILDGGPTEQETAFVGLSFELRVDYGNKSLRLHDAVKEGGYEFLNRDQSDARYQERSTELDGLDFGAQDKGILTRTSAGRYKIRKLTVNTANMELTNPRGTAGDFYFGLAAEISSDHKWTGAHQFTDPIDADGGVVGNVTGNLTGDSFGTHTGDVTGDVTGDLHGDSFGKHTGSLDTTGATVTFDDGQIPAEAIDPQAFVNRGIPLGGIIMWSGLVDDIPESWALCNGANGTPDLRNRFIVGAGDDYLVDATGGTATPDLSFTSGAHEHIMTVGGHALTEAEMPAHHHNVSISNQTRINHDKGDNGDRTLQIGHSMDGRYMSDAGNSQPHTHPIDMDPSGAHSHDITLDPGGLFPPYYALCYIMKVV